MLLQTGRARAARRVFALAAFLLLAVFSPAAGNEVIVRDIFVEDFAPAYPDARGAALQRAMKQAVAAATGGTSRPDRVSTQRAENLVSFVEVLQETIRPEYYALRVSIGLRGPNLRAPEEAEASAGPLPVVHPVHPAQSGAAAPPAAEGSAPVLLSLKVPRGTPGALAGYRAVLAGLAVQHVRIHPNPDLLLDVTVRLRRLPARLPEPPPGSGVLISEAPDAEPRSVY